jgi:hypothetical protein
VTVPNIKEISPDWKGETCFILAGGPSLSGFPVEILRGRGRVIAVNSSYRLCPWADLLFFSDPQWYQWEQEKNPELLATLIGRMMTVGEIPDHSIHRLALTGTDDIEPLPDRVHGNNSGYQAINVAYHFGVKRIVLLGFDMKVQLLEEPRDSLDAEMRLLAERCLGKSHWHEGHPDGISLEQRQKVLSEILLPPFATLVLTLEKAGIEIINCTPGSAITCFPMRSIEELLAA